MAEQPAEPAIRMVSAWASAKQLILSQVKVTDRSNEIMVIPELLTPWKWPDARPRFGAMGLSEGDSEGGLQRREPTTSCLSSRVGGNFTMTEPTHSTS